MVELNLTARGRDAAQRLPMIGATVLNEQLHGFSRAELDSLVGMLARIIGYTPMADCSPCGIDEEPSD